MNSNHKTEFSHELGVTMIALRELSIPSKGQPKGFYLKSYKYAYEIMKPILGDMFRWDVSLNGREEMKELLSTHSNFLQREIKKDRNKVLNKKTFMKIKNEKTKVKNETRRVVKNTSATKIQKMVRRRLGKIYIPIQDIPLNIIFKARAQEINLHDLFQITLQSATNPNLTMTIFFRNLPHLENFVSTAVEGSGDKPNYGLNKFKINGVMDNVKITEIKQTVGGCSKHDAKKHTKVYENHIYKFNVVSQVSLHNNCGIECLRHIIRFKGTPEDIRRHYDIKRKTKMTFEQLHHIYIKEIKKDHRPLALITPQTTGVVEMNRFNYLFFDGEHYYNLDSVEALQSSRKVKRGKCFWDIETRLTEDKIYIKSLTVEGKKVIKESRILKDAITAIYYKPYKATEYKKLILTTNSTTTSVRQFADWLIEQAQDNKFYRCVAHNGSRFDMYFFLASLTKQETLLSKMNLRGTSIIGMNFFNHEFIDSCCHLLNSLDNLCKSYKVATPKLKTFKYTNEQLCFYKPNLHFNEFMDLKEKEPEFWEIYTNYCMYDCVSLEQV